MKAKKNAGGGAPIALKEVLRRNGWKATAPRLAVLSLLAKTKRPMSAQNIIDALPHSRRPMRLPRSVRRPARGAGAIDQATAYRTLAAFKAKGIIRQVDLRHNHAHYELADVAEHHHLICTRCGRVEDVRHCGIEAVQAAALRGAKHFAEITQHSLEFYGTCTSCASKLK